MAEGGFDNPTFDPEDPEVPGNDDDDNEDAQDHYETTSFLAGLRIHTRAKWRRNPDANNASRKGRTSRHIL